RCAREPAARMRPPREARISFGGEVSWRSLQKCSGTMVAAQATRPLLRTLNAAECKLPRFGIRKLDHAGPLLGFGSDELPKLGGRTGKHCAAQVANSRPDLRIGDGRVDFLVELVDDLDGRFRGHTDAIPLVGVIAWD